MDNLTFEQTNKNVAHPLVKGVNEVMGDVTQIRSISTALHPL